MLWVELSIDTPSEFVEPLTQVFTEHGEGGVAIELPAGHNPDEGEEAPIPERVTVTTYIPHDNRLEGRYARIDTAVRLVAYIGDVSELRVRVVEEEEWQDAWKEHFHALRIGTRTVIVPTWRTYEPREDDVVITIDPGMAFGTGHHPTTRMCLELLEMHVEQGDRVLDLGCGSGVLSIAAAKLGASDVLGLEIDPTAARVAERNVPRKRSPRHREDGRGDVAAPPGRSGRIRPAGCQRVGEGHHRVGGTHRPSCQERGDAHFLRDIGQAENGSHRAYGGAWRAVRGRACRCRLGGPGGQGGVTGAIPVSVR